MISTLLLVIQTTSLRLKQGELVKADDKDNVIQSDILKSLYEMEVRIEEIRDNVFVYIMMKLLLTQFND